jgi:hypothetical protein
LSGTSRSLLASALFLKHVKKYSNIRLASFKHPIDIENVIFAESNFSEIVFVVSQINIIQIILLTHTIHSKEHKTKKILVVNRRPLKKALRTRLLIIGLRLAVNICLVFRLGFGKRLIYTEKSSFYI